MHQGTGIGILMNIKVVIVGGNRPGNLYVNHFPCPGPGRPANSERVGVAVDPFDTGTLAIRSGTSGGIAVKAQRGTSHRIERATRWIGSLTSPASQYGSRDQQTRCYDKRNSRVSNTD